jgi:hypothetical protein
MSKVIAFSNQVTLTQDNLQELEYTGRAISKTNPQMKAFGEIMSHPVFSNFVRERFSNYEDTRCTLMILKTAEAIKNSFYQKTGEEISGHQLTALLSQFMLDRPMRTQMMGNLKEFMSENVANTLDFQS